MKYVNENPSDKKPYWAFGYPYPCCGNCGHFVEYGTSLGRCSAHFDEIRDEYRPMHERTAACENYMQNVERIG